MAGPSAPRSRQESRQQTREALIFAARASFARDGYHGANLDAIAREAGYSKGAVYSNFDGKAALFLAVMDANMEAALAEGAWDVFQQPEQQQPERHEPEQQETGPYGSDEVVEAIKGFALATLEFIATAARDESLAAELGKRMQGLIDANVGLAEHSRPEGEELSAGEVGALLTALDQGVALLTLGGSVAIDQQLLRVGMQRLLDPGRPTPSRDAAEGDDRTGGPALHDSVIRERIAAALRDQPR
jgi:AcrR family transcriptional regulator